VTVTIARDGTVISASLTSPSGNAAFDQSIRAALDRVRQVPPFPPGAREDRRTVIINFNLLAKRLPG
jgi:TonB family protein